LANDDLADFGKQRLVFPVERLQRLFIRSVHVSFVVLSPRAPIAGGIPSKILHENSRRHPRPRLINFWVGKT
jgi:hypothetical protein